MYLFIFTHQFECCAALGIPANVWHFVTSAVMSSHANGRFVYKWEQLIELPKPSKCSDWDPKSQMSLKRSCCSCRAGTKWRERRRRRFKPLPPLIIIGNVRSLIIKWMTLGLWWEHSEWMQCYVFKEINLCGVLSFSYTVFALGSFFFF